MTRRKTRSYVLPLFLVVLGMMCGGILLLLFRDSPDLTNYKRVKVGMSVEEVESILGPGTPVKPSQVPGIVVALNPQDAIDQEEKARRSGGPPPTVRNYPTRLKPVVEGDLILRWENSRTGERILVAFKDGKVIEKDYWDPNYL